MSVEIYKRGRESLWPDQHLDAGTYGEEDVLSELFRAHITTPITMPLLPDQLNVQTGALGPPPSSFTSTHA